jgi:hypothetical protein
MRVQSDRHFEAKPKLPQTRLDDAYRLTFPVFYGRR